MMMVFSWQSAAMSAAIGADLVRFHAQDDDVLGPASAGVAAARMFCATCSVPSCMITRTPSRGSPEGSPTRDERHVLPGERELCADKARSNRHQPRSTSCTHPAFTRAPPAIRPRRHSGDGKISEMRAHSK